MFTEAHFVSLEMALRDHRHYLERHSPANTKRIEDMLMALSAQVQALLDAVAAQNAQINDSVAEIRTLEQSVTDLQAKVDAATANASNPDDLAAVAQATASITASVANLKSVMPAPVPPATTAAAAAPAPATGASGA